MERLYTEDRELPCPLTDPELLAKGDALAAALQDLEAEKDGQATAKAQMKERLEALNNDVNRISRQIQERREFRMVPVDIEVKDSGKALVCEVRKDTGEIIRERFMTEDERARPLPM
jgi:hypothetical protein